MEKERIQYLDIVKVIAIFLVVFCHFVLLGQTVAANLFMVACWAGVPLFFMVNGILLLTRPLDLKKHVRKTLTIYAVLLAWRLIYLIAVGAICHVPPESFGKNELFCYLFAFGSLEGIGTGHLWFIEALLAVYLVFPLMHLAFEWEHGRGLILFFAIYCLLMTNGLTGAQMLLDGLAAQGIVGNIALDGLQVLNPFGTYANMLGFFLLGAWIHTGPVIAGSLMGQRLAGAALSVAGLAGMWGVEWYTSRTPIWDGILLVEGYRHLPVILLALGIFLLCRDARVRSRIPGIIIRTVASRTLGVYYLHWIFGWLLVPWMALQFSGYSVGTNLLKTVALILPALFCTFLIERIPVLKHLVTG